MCEGVAQEAKVVGDIKSIVSIDARQSAAMSLQEDHHPGHHVMELRIFG
jgi:hypothetical protein